LIDVLTIQSSTFCKQETHFLINIIFEVEYIIYFSQLLHGRRIFGNRTADEAHELLKIFYLDHELFYRSLQNYVLHVHIHFSELYRNHGSLSNINTFSQEDLMGSVSKCKHGSRYWADQLAFYLNVSFYL
jgi:hypothetical protein